MSRSKRLKRIAEIRRIEEEVAARNLRQARAQHDHWLSIQENLRQYGEHYRARDVRTDKSAASFRQERQFVRQLDQAYAEQQKQMALVTGELDRRTDRWRTQRAKLKATESLVERLASQDQHNARRADDRATDELAGQMAARSRRP